MKKPRKSDEEKRDVVMAYTSLSDPFFEKVAEDAKVIEEMLQVILENPQLRIKPETVIAQKSILNLQGRSIRVDAYAEGREDVVFNIEIQRADNCNHPKRIRYNSSVITANRSEPGDDFEDIQELYVIYISETDILNTGKTIVHQETRIRETDQLIDDGLHVVYVNAEIPSNTKVGRYMEQFKKPYIESDEFANLKSRVNGLKNDETEVRKMCKELKEYAEKTVKEDNVRAIRVLIENGVPYEKVSAAYPTCTNEIQKIFNEFTKKNS